MIVGSKVSQSLCDTKFKILKQINKSIKEIFFSLLAILVISIRIFTLILSLLTTNTLFQSPQLTEKEATITKLKEKLKSVLEYNNLFADENDRLKEQHTAMVKYIEECKMIVQELQAKNVELNETKHELEDRVNKFEVPDRGLLAICCLCDSNLLLLFSDNYLLSITQITTCFKLNFHLPGAYVTNCA